MTQNAWRPRATGRIGQPFIAAAGISVCACSAPPPRAAGTGTCPAGGGPACPRPAAPRPAPRPAGAAIAATSEASAALMVPRSNRYDLPRVKYENDFPSSLHRGVTAPDTHDVE